MKIDEIRQQFPQYADLPDGELVRGLHRKFYADVPYPEFLRKIDFRPVVDPTADMSGTQKALAGAGKAFVDVGRGVRQITGSDATTMGGLVTGDKRSAIQREIDDARETDAPLMKTGAGLAGNIAGNVAAFAPTAFIPGVNTYTGAAALGGALGAVQPVATGDSRATNTGLGAVAGLGGQAAGNALGRALRPVSQRLSGEEQALAAAAQREGIPLTAGQATGSKPLQVTESVLENLPFTSGSQVAGKQAQKDAFQQAVLSRAGISGNAATPEVLAAQKATVGGGLGDIAERGKLDFNQGLTDQLAAITDRATKHLPPAKASQVAEQVDQILSQVDKTGTMAGTNYQGWREPLRALSKKGDEFSSYYGDIRKALDTAFRDQLPGAEGEAFRDLSRKYANLKTISAAMGGATKEGAIGNIAPAQLSAALSGSIGREGKALGRGDLNELSRVGLRFVSPNIPDSGTAQRLLAQSLLTGGGAGLGAGAAAATGNDPIKGAGYGLAAGASTLALPKLAQALMNSTAGQAYLKKGAISLTEGERRMLTDALRTAGMGAIPQLAAQ